MSNDAWSRHNLFNLMTAISKANPKATEEELFLKISDAMVTRIRPSDQASARIEALEAALRPTQDYLALLRRSVSVGPLTNNPTKEAALLKRMMEATAAALAPEQGK